MVELIKAIKQAFIHLMFPHTCAGCGSDNISNDMPICLRCLYNLPKTGFESFAENPVEKIFWGRVALASATAQYYFTKASMIQRLMHLFKYKGAKEIGLFLGRLMGEDLKKAARFHVDALIPIPLYEKKQKLRGYNQATVLCEGISGSLNIPVLEKIVTRPSFTETQTKKGRVERWKNIEGKFIVTNAAAIEGRHIMLVDDIVTTGATIESCANELKKVKGVEISLATLCFSSH